MRNTLTAAAAMVAMFATAQELPQASPLARTEQTVGLTKVSVEYSRPSAKGRKVFGDIVPFGQLWRTGANASTKLTFDGPVTIGGKQVPAGTYALLSFPGKETWEVVLNADAKVNNAQAYDAAKNVATVKVPVQRTETTETFTIGFDNVVNDGADISIAWENTKVVFRVDAPALEAALKNIDVALGAADVSAGAYHAAARYCVDNGVRLKDALAWAKKSVEMDASRFWVHHTLALAYAANGDKANAIKAAKVSKEMAAKDGAEAYVKLNDAKIAEWSK